jgi:hypothetical protein
MLDDDYYPVPYSSHRDACAKLAGPPPMARASSPRADARFPRGIAVSDPRPTDGDGRGKRGERGAGAAHGGRADG